MWRKNKIISVSQQTIKSIIRKRTFYLSMIVIILFMACTPLSKSKIINFLIDGIPSHDQQDTITSKPVDINSSKTDSILAKIRLGGSADSGLVYYHPPFKEKACTTCHTSDEPNAMSHSQNKVCYSCHKDFKDSLTVVHGPVAAGECTACHLPHSGPNKQLLKRNGQALCTYCHESNLVMKNKAHEKIGTSSCIECHGAHGGKDRWMLITKKE